MKNIIIMGIGRAGKTTLSEMIKQKYKEYNLIHSDSIKWALIDSAGKTEYYRKNIKKQKEFEHGEYFQKVLLNFFNSCIEEDINKHGTILESGQLTPKYVSEMVDLKNTIVICLAHGNLKKEDIVNLCRENDIGKNYETDIINEKQEKTTVSLIKDWTYDIKDEELEAHAEKWAEMNELLKVDCPKYGIKYIDTSKNRKEVLNNILQKLEKEME